MDGTKCYDRTVEVRSNSIRYINSVMFKNFSEIDILCGKVDTFDMNGNFDKNTEDCDIMEMNGVGRDEVILSRKKFRSERIINKTDREDGYDDQNSGNCTASLFGNDAGLCIRVFSER